VSIEPALLGDDGPRGEQLESALGWQPELTGQAVPRAGLHGGGDAVGARPLDLAPRLGAHDDLLDDEVDVRYATTEGNGPGEVVQDAGAGIDGTPPDVVVCDELAYLIEAARAAAWVSHCNVLGAAYYDRKEALARLRGALGGYDRARGVV
jgi:hypothetical protein